jgi:hypothetical protein
MHLDLSKSSEKNAYYCTSHALNLDKMNLLRMGYVTGHWYN